MTTLQKDYCLDLAKHTIGMDSREVYRTHGEKVYVPYRNYFTAPQPEEAWELMVKEGYARRTDGKDYVTYRMTPDGILWMVQELRVYICLTY